MAPDRASRAYAAHREGQSLLGRRRSGSWSSDGSYSLATDVELDHLEDASLPSFTSSREPRWWTRPRVNSKLAKTPTPFHSSLQARRKRSRAHRLWRLVLRLAYLLLALLVLTGVFFPSYTTPPQRYTELRRRVTQATRGGMANPHNEKVFIAASLYDKDGRLLRGDWAQSVLHLIDMLGHDNVFVSIYENDPGEDAMSAMYDFRQRLPCESSVLQEQLDTDSMPHVVGTDGTPRLKRMSFLADVRNRALQPLNDVKSPAYDTRWDRLLYLNDVVFDPVDAVNLLFNTNVDGRTGRAHYRAACSVDFINPFKFYDTFATRDLEGFGMGVPFYPWFTNAGQGQSRQDVLDQKDAVRVKSCWGGMVAFEAKWFQRRTPTAREVESMDVDDSTTSATTGPAEAETPTAAISVSQQDTQSPNRSHSVLARSSNATMDPLRFRSEPEIFWDASECCLIHADLAHLASLSTADTAAPQSTGAYMNPYVRVAYSRSTLAWLPFTRRFERLYPHIHTLVNWIGARPGSNPRQTEQPGQEVVHHVWRWDDATPVAPLQSGNATAHADRPTGAYVEETLRASPGMFCGTRKLFYIREGDAVRPGGKNWAVEAAPPAR